MNRLKIYALLTLFLALISCGCVQQEVVANKTGDENLKMVEEKDKTM